jgi:hypothetical protein
VPGVLWPPALPYVLAPGSPLSLENLSLMAYSALGGVCYFLTQRGWLVSFWRKRKGGENR